MPDIAAPKPRLPAPQSPSGFPLQDQQWDQDPFLLSFVCPHVFISASRPTSCSTQPSRPFVAPPRLLSPIALREPPYVALNSKSPTPCAGSLKRRGTPRVSRTARRRLHLPRIDCPLDPFRHTLNFEQLPWISALDTPPRHGHDIADLSQIPLSGDFSPFTHSAPASGPVRRRKTALRSNPLTFAGDEFSPLRLFPLAQAARPRPVCPRTPPPRVAFDPSRVIFHNLMPVFPHGTRPDSPVSLTPTRTDRSQTVRF